MKRITNRKELSVYEVLENKKATLDTSRVVEDYSSSID